MAKKTSDDVQDAAEEPTTEVEGGVLPPFPGYDASLARVQQRQYLLISYVDMVIKAESIIGSAEAADRVRASLDHLKAMADDLAAEA